MYAKILQYDGEEIPAWPGEGQCCYRCRKLLARSNLGNAKFGNLYVSANGMITITWEWFCAGCAAIVSQTLQGKRGADE